jgi:hypothetical protein
MVVLLLFELPERGGSRRRVAIHRTTHRLQSVGTEVQAELAESKVAVAELQVQPAYQVSVASRTAPT